MSREGVRAVLLWAPVCIVLLLIAACGATPTVQDPLRGVVALRTETNETVCAGIAVEARVVLTAAHCFEAPVKYIQTAHGPRGIASVERVGERDLARVTLTDSVPEFRPLAKRRPFLAEPVCALGFPRGMGPLATCGLIANPSVSDPEIGTDLVALDLSITPGMSGAGVVNSRGEVVAIITLGWRPYRFGFGEPVNP